jgi:multisubunit Na+/H+ antiporter MnhB subunit
MNDAYDLFGLLINVVWPLSMVGVVVPTTAIIVVRTLHHREPGEKRTKLVRTLTTILGVSLGLFLLILMKRLVIRDGPPSFPDSYVNEPTTF